MVGATLPVNDLDRWELILSKLKDGDDCGAEFRHPGKNSTFVTVLGRRMTIGEAADLSGIDNSFFKKYENQIVPVEDIIDKLNYLWVKEKIRRLKRGLR